MANNDEQSLIIVLFDDDEQQLPAIPAILPIGPPPDYKTDSDDEEEQIRDVIQVEVNKFYEVLENPRRRGTNYFRYPICRGSGRTKLLKGLMSLLQHAQMVMSLELQIHRAFGHHLSDYIDR